ncbi:MAG TPA: type IV pilus modification protein PilV [Oceanospirillales bacterium]|nr:type IV pilus modification protein PilV [Oceanospirillaceae bacterium]HBS42912.1 type IV pilus modification protein PilV [Oceanospirillales bacterium]|tara:strand:- start:1607 stop:2218 length:612 start_codon:yes stop_codon:yes gene_type:complete
MLMRSGQRGITLIEVGVTLAVTTVGLLGLTAMQLHSVRSSKDSVNRAQAVWVANDLINRIRANEITDYTTSSELFCGDMPQTIKACSAYYSDSSRVATDASCSGAEMAVFDTWEALCGMPSGDNTVGSAGYLIDPSLSITATGGLESEHTITISWVSRTTSDDAYVTSSTVTGRNDDGSQRFLVDQSNVSANQRSSYSISFWP